MRTVFINCSMVYSLTGWASLVFCARAVLPAKTIASRVNSKERVWRFIGMSFLGAWYFS